MGNLIKSTLSLSADAVKVLEANASPRKRGELVSKLLIEYGAGVGGIDAVDVETVKLQIMGLAAANKALEARVIRLERQVAGQKQAESLPTHHRGERQ